MGTTGIGAASARCRKDPRSASAGVQAWRNCSVPPIAPCPSPCASCSTTRPVGSVELHRKHANHQLVRVLQLTGFDVDYEHASGSWLTDRDGNRYLDLLAGFGVFALGRNHPVIKAALAEALALDLPNLVQLDAPLPAGLLAERLCDLAGPGIDRCFFGNSGAEAVETAIKLARRFTDKPRILYADHTFHGLTTGSLALNGGDDFRAGFGPLIDAAAVPYGDLDALATRCAMATSPRS